MRKENQTRSTVMPLTVALKGEGKKNVQEALNATFDKAGKQRNIVYEGLKRDNPLALYKRKISAWYYKAINKIESCEKASDSKKIASWTLHTKHESIQKIICEMEESIKHKIDISNFVDILKSDLIFNLDRMSEKELSGQDVCEWITEFTEIWDEHKEELKNSKHEKIISSLRDRLDEVLSVKIPSGWKESLTSAENLLAACPMLKEWQKDKDEMEANGTLLRNQEGKNFDNEKLNYIRENLAIWLERVLKESKVDLPIPLKDIRKINPYLARSIVQYKSIHNKSKLEKYIQSQIK